jgi:hypothetical protein
MRQIGGIVLLAVRVGLFHEAGFPFRIHFCGFGNCVTPRRRGRAFQQRSVLIQIRTPPLNFRSAPIPSPVVRSRSHDAVIRVYDEAGNVIETHEHIGEFKEP